MFLHHHHKELISLKLVQHLQVRMSVSNFSRIRIWKSGINPDIDFLHRPTSAVGLLINHSRSVWCVGATARGEGWGGRKQTKWTGNAQYMAFHACQDQAAAAGNQISKWRCRCLPAAGWWTESGVRWGRPLDSGAWTALWCLLLQLLMVRHRIRFHSINYRLSPLCPGRQRRPWLFALCFPLSYEYFHIRISGPKFDISINNPTYKHPHGNLDWNDSNKDSNGLSPQRRIISICLPTRHALTTHTLITDVHLFLTGDRSSVKPDYLICSRKKRWRTTDTGHPTNRNLETVDYRQPNPFYTADGSRTRLKPSLETINNQNLTATASVTLPWWCWDGASLTVKTLRSANVADHVFQPTTLLQLCSYEWISLRPAAEPPQSLDTMYTNAKHTLDSGHVNSWVKSQQKVNERHWNNTLDPYGTDGRLLLTANFKVTWRWDKNKKSGLHKL